MPEADREFCSATGKLLHRTPQLAARVAKNQGRFGKSTQPYRCEHCGFWHTGRAAKTVKLQRTARLGQSFERVLRDGR